MINPNEIAFLELLKASLFQIQPAFPSGLDWSEILEITKKQTVAALVEPKVPKEYVALWKKASAMSFRNNLRNQYEQNGIIGILQAHDIPVVVLKGSAAAMYYPEPARRSMGDIDLLVPEKNYQEAKNLQVDNGFKFIKEDYRNGVFVKESMNLELHYQFSSEEKDIERVVCEGLAHPEIYQVCYYSFPGLPPYANDLVLLDHVRQHMVRSGLGFRQVIDWMMFAHAELDNEAWENSFRPMAKEAGLETFAITLTKMCKMYLGLPDQITWCDGGNSEACVCSDKG